MDDKRRARAWGFGAVLLFLSVPVLADSRPERLYPLIQLQGNEFLCTASQADLGGTVCLKGISRERVVSIYRNSRAMSATSEGRYDKDAKPVNEPAVSTLRDGYLVWRDVVALNEYLESIGIEDRKGGCNPFTTVPDFKAGSAARYTIFWYSRDGRRTSIPIGTDFSKRCPPEILDLFTRLTRLGRAVRIPDLE
jgi:hypothetical protein